VTDLLSSDRQRRCGRRLLEQLLPIAQLLIDHKFDNPRIYRRRQGCYELEDYDLAEKYLKIAEKDGTLDDENAACWPNCPTVKPSGPKKEIREKEDHADKAHELPRVELRPPRADCSSCTRTRLQHVANFISLVERAFITGWYSTACCRTHGPGWRSHGSGSGGRATALPANATPTTATTSWHA